MTIKEPLFWLACWLGMPWVGCVLTLLGNPNRLYSRRVLMWSVGCFVVLSVGLLSMHGDLPAAWTSVVTRQHSVLGMALALGLALAAWPDGQAAMALGSLGCFLLAMVGFSEKIWPLFFSAMALVFWICRPLFLITDQNGKQRSSGINRLRFTLLVGLCLVTLWILYEGADSLKTTSSVLNGLSFLNAWVSRHLVLLISMALILSIGRLLFSILDEHKKKNSPPINRQSNGLTNRLTNRQRIIFVGLCLAMLWGLYNGAWGLKLTSSSTKLSHPVSFALFFGYIFLCLPTDYLDHHRESMKENYPTNLLGQFLWVVLAVCSIYVLAYTIPVIMDHIPFVKTFVKKKPYILVHIPLCIMVEKIARSFQIFKKGYGRLPLAADKKTLYPEASPEWITFWNPWQRLNMGLYEMFMWFIVVTLSVIFWINGLSQGPLAFKPEYIFTMVAFPITVLLTMLHVYALFQPRTVPYRVLLLCSMGYCMFALLAMAWPLLPALYMPGIGCVMALGYGIVLWRVLRPLVLARRYAALLNPDHAQEPTGSALSRGWVVALISSSVLWGIWLYSAELFQMIYDRLWRMIEPLV